MSKDFMCYNCFSATWKDEICHDCGKPIDGSEPESVRLEALGTFVLEEMSQASWGLPNQASLWPAELFDNIAEHAVDLDLAGWVKGQAPFRGLTKGAKAAHDSTVHDLLENRRNE